MFCFPDEEQIGEGIMEGAAEVIRDGKAVLGIEFGSTRIKAVLVAHIGAAFWISSADDWYQTAKPIIPSADTDSG